MEKEKIFRYLYILANDIVKYVSFAAVSIVGGMALLFYVTSAATGGVLEKISFHKHSLWTYIFCIIFFSVLFALKKNIEKIKPNILFMICSCIFVTLGFALVWGIGTELRGDMYWVKQAAREFAANNYTSLREGGYIFHYPHQLGLVTYERILFAIISQTEILFIANVFWGILINWCSWKISQCIFGKKIYIANMTIILSFLFLPQFFLNACAYGIIPGFALMMLAYYFQLSYFRERKIGKIIASFFCIGLSCLLRSNYLIGAIMMALVYLLYALKKKNLKVLICFALTLCIAILPQRGVETYYEWESGGPISSGEPKLLWVAMGLRDESTVMGGWYDAFNYNTYEDTNYNGEVCTEIAKESIKSSINHFYNNPLYALQFFGNKIRSTWCDPLFQSLWLGPLEGAGQEVRVEKLKSLYEEGTAFKLVLEWSKIVLIFIYVMTWIYLLIMIIGKKQTVFSGGIIYFIGGFLFYLFWETKSQYVYSNVFGLIPYAVYAFEFIQEKIKDKVFV